MNQGSGFILVILGLLLLYTVISGKFAILENAFNQLFNLTPPVNQIDKSKVESGIKGRPEYDINKPITLPEIFIPDYRK